MKRLLLLVYSFGSLFNYCFSVPAEQLNQILGNQILIQDFASPILDPIDLKCSWLESNCCWSNVKDRQQHNWMLAIGAPSAQALLHNFGDAEGPGPVYLMLSPGTIDHTLSSHMTVFQSCPIKCSTGILVVKFKYWLLEGMTLDVCLHSLTKSNPTEGTYSSCRRLQRNFGYAEIRFAAVQEKSLAIVSRFGTTNTLGIIDDVRVEYVPCSENAWPTRTRTTSPLVNSAALSTGRLTPLTPAVGTPQQIHPNHGTPLIPVSQSAPGEPYESINSGELSKSLVRERTQVTRVSGTHCLGEGVSLKCTQACIRLVSDLLVVALCRNVELGNSACLCLHKKQDLKVDGFNLRSVSMDIEKSILEQQLGGADNGRPVDDIDQTGGVVSFRPVEEQHGRRAASTKPREPQNLRQVLPNNPPNTWDNLGNSANQQPPPPPPFPTTIQQRRRSGGLIQEPWPINLPNRENLPNRNSLPDVHNSASFQSPQPSTTRNRKIGPPARKSLSARDVLGVGVGLSQYNANGVDAAWTSREASCPLEEKNDCCWSPLDNNGWTRGRGKLDVSKMQEHFRSSSVPKDSFLVLFADETSTTEKIYELNSCSIRCSSGPITVAIRSWRSPRAQVQLCYEDRDSRFCAPIPAAEGVDNAPHIEVLPEASKFRLVLTASGLQPGDMVIIDELNVHFNACEGECLGRNGIQACDHSCGQKMGGRHVNSTCITSDLTSVNMDSCVCSFNFSSEIRSKPLQSIIGPAEILEIQSEIDSSPNLTPHSPCYGDSALKDCAIACVQRLQEKRELEVASCEADSKSLGMKCVCMVKKPVTSAEQSRELNNCDPDQCQLKCLGELGPQFSHSVCDYITDKCHCDKKRGSEWGVTSKAREYEERADIVDEYDDFNVKDDRPWKAAKNLDVSPQINIHDVKVLDDDYENGAGALMHKTSTESALHFKDKGPDFEVKKGVLDAPIHLFAPPSTPINLENPHPKRIHVPDPPAKNLNPISRDKSPKSYVTRKIVHVERNDRSLCDKIQCDFEAQTLCNLRDLLEKKEYGVNRSLKVLSGEIGDIKTAGIPGPASLNSMYYLGGWMGPHDRIGFSIDDLYFHRTRVIRFRIYEASKKSRVFVCFDTPDTCPLSTLKVRRDVSIGDGNNWITHSITLPINTTRVLFIAENASDDIGAVGFDDIRLLKPNPDTNIAEDAFWPACTNILNNN